ncbi:MAG: hypothetical protein IJW93_02800 [Clostridia bacterium]|nr:hypothetical protein [Clostridia bacterium]
MFKNKKVISIVLLLSLMLTFFLPLTASAAATTSYSAVIDDLYQDSSFDINSYPGNATDYSLDVIQIAEGENGELFVYVYNPSDSRVDLKASMINIAFDHPSDSDIDFSLYPLTWLSSYGTLDKYIVNGFAMSDEEVRYYSIATVYRPFVESLGDVHDAETDDVTNYKGYAVNCSWACGTDENGNYFCNASLMNTVDVTIHAIGFTRYDGGFDIVNYDNEAIDSHFVAFSIDNFTDVRHIYDAEISFYSQVRTYAYSSLTQEKTLNSEGDPVYHELTIRDTDSVTTDFTGTLADLFGFSYSWNRISTVEQFKSDTEEQTNTFVSSEQEASLSKAQFVFRFYETEYSEWEEMLTLCGQRGTEVTEVTILRLKFLSGTTTYNLGVVSDVVSDDGKPDYEVDFGDSLQNKMDAYFGDAFGILFLIIFIIVLFLAFTAFKPVLKLIGDGIKEIFMMIINVIFLPFRLLGRLFRPRNKQKKRG